MRSLQQRLTLEHHPLQPQTPVFQPNRLGCYPWTTLTRRRPPTSAKKGTWRNKKKRGENLFSLVLICRRPTGGIAAGTAWDNCNICAHLSPTHNLSQALTTGLPAKLELSSTSQASRRSMPGTDYGSAINDHRYRSVVPGSAGGHVPGRSAAYENQAVTRLFSTATDWRKER